MARLREVPLVRAPELDLRADPSGETRVWLALEALQVTGSFKVRGALTSLDANRSRGHVVVASAGNHGAGVAYAARVLGLSATVCVPQTAPQGKRARIERYGAELVVAPSTDYDDAENLAKEIAIGRGSVFVSPYENLDAVRGNGSSLGFEIVRALGGVPERVLVPFGGGGLATGLSWALAADADGVGQRVVWGVQSEASCAMATSIEGGIAVADARAGPPTLADGLTGGIPAGTFARAAEAIAGIVVATEAQIAAAMVHAYRDMGLVVEGSAAVALAPVLFGLPEPIRGGDLVVVLTGRNVDREQLEAVLGGAAE
ncbi:MAG: pyridoxal-phosphate dependent enzyme [Myxococcota bacterium]|nr:pyridoxal-phosphate dependent enzyme [Myxococcota bacterium]